MLPWFTEQCGNPHSVDHEWGWEAEEVVEAARRQLAVALGMEPAAITFTSGANAGLSRAVQTYLAASGAMSFSFGFPFAPAPGDAFNAVRGCLLTMADCTAQANLVHFRGQPFTPPAVTGVS